MSDSTVKTRKTTRKSAGEAEAVKKTAKHASTTATDAMAKVTPKPRQRSVTAKIDSTTAKAADKPAIAKATRTRKTVPKKKSATSEERYQMICTAAYFIAEKRGFEGGYEMNDWIAAEAQIDATLNGQ